MPGSPSTALEVQGLQRSFGGLRAVDRVDLKVAHGSLTGVIGPNGAGKSTLFQLMVGALAPDAGRVLLEGKDVTALRAHERARRGLVRSFQIPRPLARMSVEENLLVAGQDQLGEHAWAPLVAGPRVRAQEERQRRRAREILDRVALRPLKDEYAGALSGGQKKLLELGRLLMVRPRVVLLDEPMAGVNPTLARRLLDMIDDLRREEGITFVLVEHDLETVFARCDPIHVMAQGRLIASGDAKRLRKDPAVIDAYLGG